MRVEVLDGDRIIYEHTVDPEEQYTELVRALRKFDAGEIDEKLAQLGDVVSATSLSRSPHGRMPTNATSLFSTPPSSS